MSLVCDFIKLIDKPFEIGKFYLVI
jgi:hypothetical protein